MYCAACDKIGSSETFTASQHLKETPRQRSTGAAKTFRPPLNQMTELYFLELSSAKLDRFADDVSFDHLVMISGPITAFGKTVLIHGT